MGVTPRLSYLCRVEHLRCLAELFGEGARAACFPVRGVDTLVYLLN
jgi:hypothetical protein